MIMRAAAVVLLVASACLSPSAGALIDGSKKAKKERPPAKNKIWDKLMRCVPAPPSPRNGTLEGGGGRFAYMVVVGPISRSKPRYGLWLYPILALRHALQRASSAASHASQRAEWVGAEGSAGLPTAERSMRGSPRPARGRFDICV